MSTPELPGALLRTRVVGHHLSARDIAQAVHVEIGHKSGTQQADSDDSIHERATVAERALRALNSSSIAAVWGAPTRVTPISSTSSSASRGLIPCAALIPTRGQTQGRTGFRSPNVAP